MKIFIKPIQFSFKDEFTIEIEGSKTINDLIAEIHLKYNEVNNASFLFRGKKLVGDKTLNEQGIKDATKLMMNKLEGEPTPTVQKSDVSPVELIKTKAKTKLIESGFQKEMVESVVNTMPNIENLSIDVILDKATVFLTNLKKESKI
jgi:hypothetical protein